MTFLAYTKADPVAHPTEEGGEKRSEEKRSEEKREEMGRGDGEGSIFLSKCRHSGSS